MIKTLKNFTYGLVLGITVIIPGVSGGTIALILGIYFKIIDTINHFKKNLKTHLIFIISLLAGMAASILMFSSLIYFLLENYPFPVFLFITGLIAGTVPYIYFKIIEPENGVENPKPAIYKFWNNLKKLKIIDIILIAAPVIILLLLSGLTSKDAANTEELFNNAGIPLMIFIFFSGILGAATLVVPAFSGSFVLLLLGIYPLIIYAISCIRVFLTDIGNVQLLFNIVKVLGPFGVGMIIGILGMAKIIEIIFKKNERSSYAVILGLLLGSIVALFRMPLIFSVSISPVIIIIGITALFLGTVVSYILGKKQF